jgi:uncharacterized protein (DUF427 family)
MRNDIDAWYEEDEQVFVHPRDPYHRVDILQSSRRVRVSVGGEVIAETQRPIVLFETGLPPRYYIPPEDVRTCLSRAGSLPVARTRVSLRTGRWRQGVS